MCIKNQLELRVRPFQIYFVLIIMVHNVRLLLAVRQPGFWRYAYLFSFKNEDHKKVEAEIILPSYVLVYYIAKV